MQRITLDGLIIADTPPVAHYFVPDTGIQGLEWASPRISGFFKQEQDGEFISKNFKGGRVVSIPIRVTGDDPADYTAKRAALIAVLAPKMANGRAVLRTAEFVLDDGSVRVLHYVGGDLRLPYQHSNYAEGNIVVRVPDPNLYGETLTGAAVLQEGGGFDILPRKKENESALSFLRTTPDFVDLDDPFTTMLNGDYSISFWFKASSHSNDHIIMGNFTGSGTIMNIETFNVNGRLRWCFGTAPACVDTGVTLPIGEWVHVVLTRDKAAPQGKAFRNGVDAFTSTNVQLGNNNASGDMYFGRDGRAATTRPLSGALDQVRFFDRVLTPEEITELYDRDTVPSDLVGEWLFDEKSGSTALDTSGNGNDGTITGATYVSKYENIPQWAEGGFSTTFDISATVGGTVVVNNAGDTESFPTITLRGALESPTITNQTTGKSLTLSGLGLLTGETVVIDMKARTIKKGDGNAISFKTATSQFWGLQPGNNTIVFTDTDFSETASATISHRSAWGGA